ncbi:MAG: DoxX family protein, partial [Thermomicrobiales bacterium]
MALDQTATYTATHAAPAPTMRVWARRSISAFAILFLLLDGVIKALQLAPAVDASAQLGYRAGLTLGIGILELACLTVYLLPRTAPLGALLLTGYLGGAVATHVRVGSPLFSVIFPILLGALLWGGLALRDRRVRALLSLHGNDGGGGGWGGGGKGRK